DACLDADDDILAGEVGLVEALDRCVKVGDDAVDVGDDALNDVGRLSEASRCAGRGNLLGNALRAGVDGKTQSNDALRGLVSPAAGVRNNRVEELVHADEVGTAHVPVRLLSVQ